MFFLPTGSPRVAIDKAKLQERFLISSPSMPGNFRSTENHPQNDLIHRYIHILCIYIHKYIGIYVYIYLAQYLICIYRSCNCMYIYIHIYKHLCIHMFFLSLCYVCIYIFIIHISSNHPGWAKLKGLHLGVNQETGSKAKHGRKGETGYVWAHTYICIYIYISVHIYTYLYI